MKRYETETTTMTLGNGAHRVKWRKPKQVAAFRNHEQTTEAHRKPTLPQPKENNANKTP